MSDLDISHRNGLSARLPDTLLSLTDIARELGVSWERLRGFANANGMKEGLGAVDVKGVKGVRYPQEALDLFRLLIGAQDEGLVTPATAPAFLARTRREPSPTAIVESSRLPEVAGQEAIIAAFVAGLQSLLPPPDDCLLTGAEAADLLRCKPAALRKRVPPVLRGRWRRSDILRYIHSL